MRTFQPARDQEAADVLAECCDQPQVDTVGVAPTVVGCVDGSVELGVASRPDARLAKQPVAGADGGRGMAEIFAAKTARDAVDGMDSDARRVLRSDPVQWV